MADKNCEKIHYIAPNVYCCGAGTSADTENTTGLISSKLYLNRMASGQETKVVSAMTLLKRHLFGYQGYIEAALVLGGVDASGPHLYSVHPHGSTDKAPYLTMGSGSLAAMAVFEARYRPGLTEAESKALVHDAICAGIFNDLGSGSNVDLVVIKRGSVEILRNMDKPNERVYHRVKPYSFPKGTTVVHQRKVFPIQKDSPNAPLPVTGDVEMS